MPSVRSYSIRGKQWVLRIGAGFLLGSIPKLRIAGGGGPWETRVPKGLDWQSPLVPSVASPPWPVLLAAGYRCSVHRERWRHRRTPLQTPLAPGHCEACRLGRSNLRSGTRKLLQPPRSFVMTTLQQPYSP